MHNRYIMWGFIVSLLLVSITCSVGPNKVVVELTEKHGAELQAIYENHIKAQSIALETGDTSLLEKTATDWELKHLTEIANSKMAHAVLEGRKVEIIELSVREYSSSAATLYVHQKILGNVSKYSSRYRLSICELKKEENKWKVARCRAPEFD